MTVAPSNLTSMSSQILEATDVSRQHTICRDLEWLTRSVNPTSDHLSLRQLMDNSYGVPSRRCRRNRKEQDLNRLLTKANMVPKVFGLDIAVSVPFK